MAARPGKSPASAVRAAGRGQWGGGLVAALAVLWGGVGVLLHAADPPAKSAPPPKAAPAAPPAATGTATAAAAPDGTDPPEGHSYHGETFNEGPRQAATLMPGTGRVRFPISTKVPDCQRFFDQGLGQLHGFWYFEAERSFRQAALSDPGCPMTYWGMALANVNNDKRAKGFIAEAIERRERATPRERMYLDALRTWHATDPKQDKDRRRAYVRALEAIVQQHPDDIEAKALLVLQIWQNHSRGWPISSHQAVDVLIDQVLAVEPMHPIHHYRIHLWDDEKPLRAVDSAARCGQAAPAIAHMWHMPGHTFSKLQRYDDAIWQQEASGRVDHAYMIRDRVLPDQIHNYAHNQEWMVRNLLHVGRVEQAVVLAKNLVELPRHPKYNTLAKRGSYQFGRTRLFEALAKFEQWETLLALAETPYLEPTDDLREQVRRLRALGVASFATGDAARGLEMLKELERRLADQKRQQQQAADKAEAAAKQAKKPADQVKKARTDAENPFKTTITAMEAALADVRGHQALADQRYADALAAFDKADGVSKELLARVQLLAGDKAKAEETARKAVAAGKQEVLPLATLVYVLAECGKREDALREFATLRKVAGRADRGLPCLARLADLARAAKWPDDWRLPQPVAGDVGQRPALDSLGPFRWTPPAAPEFRVTGAAGETVSLSDYRGRPVVVIFYLGSGCVHCVEQLKGFGPLAVDFQNAGIELLAISTETAVDLRESLDLLTDEEQFDFPLAADPELTAFRAWRCFDDFEQQPLHGTFLIDGAGRMRWMDVSYEPFADGKFLLAEAKRLLALDRGTAASPAVPARRPEAVSAAGP